MSSHAHAPLRVLIADDEERARRTLRALLDREPDVEVVGETGGADTVRAIRELRPDLLFLDVQMPGRDGFAVLAELESEEIPVVVFVTAYEEHALEAFEVAAVDYLLKPFSDARFTKALERARERLAKSSLAAVREGVEQVLERVGEARASSAADTGDPNAPLIFRDATRTHLVRAADIDWIEAKDVYVRIHAGARTLLIRASLQDLEERLAPLGFYRIHRSALVQIDRITELRHRSHGDYRVLLKDGTELRLTRTRKAGLEERLGHSIS